MKLIKDLGMHYPKETSSRKVRYGLYECPKCFKHFRTSVSQGKKETAKCAHCACLNNSNSDRTTHGLSKTPLYSLWFEIKRRCTDKTRADYKNYGGKGVTMCKIWRDNPEIFVAWAKNNGWKKGLHIDKDELSHKLNISPAIYSPETCQFVTQAANNSFKGLK